MAQPTPPPAASDVHQISAQRFPCNGEGGSVHAPGESEAGGCEREGHDGRGEPREKAKIEVLAAWGDLVTPGH